MRPVFLDSRGTRSQAKSRNHHINATRGCKHYDTPKQRPRHNDNIEVGYSCLDCKHRKNTAIAQRLCVGILMSFIAIIMLVVLADAFYCEAQNAQRLSDSYKLQYQTSRIGDNQ